MLVVVGLIAAIPLAPLGGKGVDVVIVADLSRSMPADSRARTLEIITLLEQRRSAGDRVGIVTYGREARIERLPEELGEASAFVQEVDRDGSDLGGAIGLAASLIPRERRGRLIVLSDGEANGTPVAAAAHRGGARLRSLSEFPGEAADIAVARSTSRRGHEPRRSSPRRAHDRTIETEGTLLRTARIARTSHLQRAQPR